MTASWPRLLCASALLVASAFAHAQYSWIDAKGTRVFSDQPPPPGTPKERILKTPRGAEARAAEQDAAPAEKPKAPPTLADRETDFRKRMEQRQADEKKAGEEAARKAADAERCALARENERALNAGVRIARYDEKGERVILSDEERAQRMERVKRTLQSCR